MTTPEGPTQIAVAGHGLEVEILELSDLRELQQCESLQRAVWRASETELVPLSQLRASQQAGGLVAGARADGELIGFCYGFPSVRPELSAEPGLHSHMTAVTERARNRGVGRALKWFQRRWCLERGLAWVEWTFDPLRAGNARFNLEHLGATVAEYLIDVYGPMEDALNAGLPSDRLMAHWPLGSRYLGDLELRKLDRPVPSEITSVLDASDDGAPEEPRLGLRGGALSVATPSDVGQLMATAPELAVSWRLAVRSTLRHYFEVGYRATRFLRGAYLLESTAGREQGRP